MNHFTALRDAVTELTRAAHLREVEAGSGSARTQGCGKVISKN